MTFSTYSDLQTNIGTWLARDDLASYIPDFIRLFEAAACRKLRVRPTEVTATLTPSSGTATLPSGFLNVRRLTWEGSTPVDLVYVHPSYLQASYPSDEEGIPRIYTIEGESILIRPTDADDNDLTLVYRARTGAVADGLQWLFNNHPDAYLFGALVEAYVFDKDEERAALWKARRDEVFNEIREVDFNYRGPMSVRVIGPTP